MAARLKIPSKIYLLLAWKIVSTQRVTTVNLLPLSLQLTTFFSLQFSVSEYL